MDIIDVMLARALTPQGQIESYAAQSQQAVARANEALANIESITEQTNENNAAAQQALQDAQSTLTEVNSALESLQETNTTQIHNEMDKLAYSLSKRTNASAIITDMVVSNPSGLATTVSQIDKMYRQTGNNEDGTMTQKAITAALDLKANAADVATKAYVDSKVAGGSGSGVSNLGIDAAGKIVIVDENGNITSGTLTEEEIAEAILNGGGSGTVNKESIGLLIDYDNKNFERVYGAANLVAGSNFNKYPMYGGRMRCNVADDGTINAFYGDENYTEDGSNGQVMIYQPKFYYQRTIITEIADPQGRVISKEQLLLSPKAKVGFKLHPLFINNDEELDYVLLPVYEGNIYDTSESTYTLNNGTNIDISNDKLSSIANTQPLICAGKNLTINNLRQLAMNRGEGWQLTDINSESALQMLFMIEFGSLNGQYSLGKGVVNTQDREVMITGSTSSLGNDSGRADTTTFINGTTTTQKTQEDATAVNYRGMENPWGNLWRVVDKISIKGNGQSYGGVPYYKDTDAIGFSLPNMSYGWISNMGIGADEYDYIYMPIKCNNKANSAVPVGDSSWTNSSLNTTDVVLIGGSNTSAESAGLFDYSCDINITAALNRTNARIMFIPTKNSIYTDNITKWQSHYGG